MTSVLFVIYLNKKDDANSLKDAPSNKYIFDLSLTILDIKKKIIDDLPKEGYNYIDLEYVSERVYKEIGKYSFENGILPRTMDILKLEQFTSGAKTYHFCIHYDNYEEKPEVNNLNLTSRLFKRSNSYSSNSLNSSKEVINNVPNYENAFPSLLSSKK
jgi:hypothetical protein